MIPSSSAIPTESSRLIRFERMAPAKLAVSLALRLASSFGTPALSRRRTSFRATMACCMPGVIPQMVMRAPVLM
ncbi:hypothetical protein D3C80_1788490 [compost metagenome]